MFDIEVSSDFGSLGTVGRGLSESGSMEESDCLRSIVLERTTELSETSSKLEEHVRNQGWCSFTTWSKAHRCMLLEKNIVEMHATLTYLSCHSVST